MSVPTDKNEIFGTWLSVRERKVLERQDLIG